MSKVNTHDYSGVCSPNPDNYILAKTFSVGVFKWIPTKDGKGVKKSAVIVRIKGYSFNPEPVYQMAERVCKELDNGTYSGTKTITVKEETK